jgi:hypothetical protein
VDAAQPPEVYSEWIQLSHLHPLRSYTKVELEGSRRIQLSRKLTTNCRSCDNSQDRMRPAFPPGDAHQLEQGLNSK